MKQELKLATVFSGIGAIEHALDRMNLSHKIVFACDNGDVDILSKKIPEDISEIEKELSELTKEIEKIEVQDEEDKLYKDELTLILAKTNEELVTYKGMNLENSSENKIKRKIKDICQRTGMLHEKINSFRILKELSKIDSYEEKKKFVDSLYKGKNESNKVKKTYMANYKLDESNFHWNVSFLDGNQYKDEVDLFVGGSPCQSFSLVGKQRGLADTRGTLFYEYARLVKEIRPKVFIYENVKALLSNDNGKTWETVSKVFTDLNYNWKYKVLNAKDYGIPQNRERVFVVGFRNDFKLEKEFEFPQPIKLEKKMQDFLIDNAPGGYFLPEKGVDFVTDEKNLTKRYTQIDGEIQLCQKKNQQFNWHGDFVFQSEEEAKQKIKVDLKKYFLSEKVRKYVLATGTKNFYSKPKTDLEVARPLLTTMHKMHRAGVDNYVTTDGRLRKLTPRECFRLMGFSDTFVIPVSDTSAYQQAGNSIVVDVLIHIMNKIFESYPALKSDEVN
ncbi:MAG: DNA (cytosine-5-)-methyltransferase [Treponema sp.]|nr:DNA (cytosine-5-)-methyltransferase [Treponema sp.]MBQ9207197.1 DNA (cytosine-5-)-methyltransferase [Treponema sp.]MBR1404991.1 DNA (cytosine-5-)-methyltransferase [Treponema sp.]